MKSQFLIFLEKIYSLCKNNSISKNNCFKTKAFHLRTQYSLTNANLTVLTTTHCEIAHSTCNKNRDTLTIIIIVIRFELKILTQVITSSKHKILKL